MDMQKHKTTIVIIDNRLKQYEDASFFQEKLEKANETLSRVGLPKL